MFKRVVLPLVLVLALATLYFWAALSWNFSEGERAGWVQKLSKKGWICKTWEGELALVSLPGTTPGAQCDDAVAEQVTRAMGQRVNLHYEEKVGLPTTCFGETRHFVNRVTVSEEIPIAAGVMVQTLEAAASAAAARAAASAASAASQ